MLASDPRCAELEAMLDSLDPRTEYVYRLALMSVSEYCRADRLFELRAAALRAILRLDEDELAEIFREARALERRLVSELATAR
jgi:hypothetical protein